MLGILSGPHKSLQVPFSRLEGSDREKASKYFMEDSRWLVLVSSWTMQTLVKNRPKLQNPKPQNADVSQSQADKQASHEETRAAAEGLPMQELRRLDEAGGFWVGLNGFHKDLCARGRVAQNCPKPALNSTNASSHQNLFLRCVSRITALVLLQVSFQMLNAKQTCTSLNLKPNPKPLNHPKPSRHSTEIQKPVIELSDGTLCKALKPRAARSWEAGQPSSSRPSWFGGEPKELQAGEKGSLFRAVVLEEASPKGDLTIRNHDSVANQRPRPTPKTRRHSSAFLGVT